MTVAAFMDLALYDPQLGYYARAPRRSGRAGDFFTSVDVGPLFQTPGEVARQAVEADVHVVGASSLAAGHLTLVPQLRAELEALGRGDIMIVVGGVVPPQDFDELRPAGAAAIFPPGTVIADAVVDLLSELEHRLA